RIGSSQFPTARLQRNAEHSSLPNIWRRLAARSGKRQHQTKRNRRRVTIDPSFGALAVTDGGSTGPKYRYWAFISYSHDDERVASRLHRALESYRLPKGVALAATAGEELPRRLFP